jgi:sugar lactone lactonase YvrE
MKRYFSGLLLSVIVLLATSSIYAQDVITTYAGIGQSAGYSGDYGPATSGQLNSPSDIIVDDTGSLYIADFSNNIIRKVDTFGNITTIAGTAGGGSYSGDNGPATAARLNGPYALAFDNSGNIIFADGYNHLVRKINMTTGIISRFAGNGTVGYGGDGGPATAANAKLNNPVGIAVDKAGNVYIADDHNNAIRKVDVSGMISTIAGTTVAGYMGDAGPATVAELNLPIGLAIDTAGNLYIAEENNNVIRKINKLGIISTYAGTHTGGFSGDGGPATNAKIDSAQRIDFDDSGYLYISDGRNNIIRRVGAAGIITTFAGLGRGKGTDSCYYGGDDTVALAANICTPQGVAFDRHHRVYICDRGNSVIRRIGPPAPVVVVVDHTGVNSISTSSPGLTVYPNPAHAGVLTATLTTAATEEAQITVTDLLGQKVYTLSATTNKQLMIDLQAAPGVYFLSAVTAHGQWNKQVVIDK